MSDFSCAMLNCTKKNDDEIISIGTVIRRPYITLYMNEGEEKSKKIALFEINSANVSHAKRKEFTVSKKFKHSIINSISH